MHGCVVDWLFGDCRPRAGRVTRVYRHIGTASRCYRSIHPGACCSGLILLILVFFSRPTVLHAQSASAVAVIAQAQSLMAANHPRQANEVLSELTQREPRNLHAWLALGNVQVAQRLYGDAMQSFAFALSIQHTSAAARAGEVRAAVADALSYRNAGDQDKALTCLWKGLQSVPDSRELLTDFGIQADAMQIYINADQALTRAHALAPKDPKTLYALAHVELDEQKMTPAETHLREYLKMEPNDATAWYGLGHLLHMVSRDDEAVRALDRSIALQPRQTASYYELGAVALDRQQDPVAKQEFLRVLAAAPHHGGALTGMGILAFRSHDYKAANQYLSQAVLYAPKYVTARRYYAMTLLRLGQKTQARREMAVAQRLTQQQNKLRGGYVILKTP